MTLEEIQHEIEQMLAVQQELQNSQISLNQSLQGLKANIVASSDRLALVERLHSLERRVRNLEQMS